MFADGEQRRECARQDVLPPARGMNTLINSSSWETGSSYQGIQTLGCRGLAKRGEEAFPPVRVVFGAAGSRAVISEGQETLGELAACSVLPASPVNALPLL